MEQKYCIIKDGVVINVIVWDGATEFIYPFPHDSIIASDTAGIGWGYQDGEFIAPVAPEQDEIPINTEPL